MPRGRPPNEPMPDWPALMTTALAARYLSVDEHSLRHVARNAGIGPVDLKLELERWRRSDLDRVVRALPNQPSTPSDRAPPSGGRGLSDADLDRIAARLRGAPAALQRRLFSLKEAAQLCGLSRATLYRMTQRGELQTVRIGARTLVSSDEVEALLKGRPG